MSTMERNSDVNNNLEYFFIFQILSLSRMKLGFILIYRSYRDGETVSVLFFPLQRGFSCAFRHHRL